VAIVSLAITAAIYTSNGWFILLAFMALQEVRLSQTSARLPNMMWQTYPGSNADTLTAAQEWVKRACRDGVICPCCMQKAKVYKRKLNGTMAYALIQIHRYFKQPHHDGWLHVPQHLSNLTTTATVRGGDWSKLRLWQLIEARPGDRGDGSVRNGYYKITPTGAAFADQKWRIPQHVFIYNQEALGYEGPDISIVDALGEKFNYTKLMRA